MDVTAWLLRHTPPRPLLVVVPGSTAARLAAEHTIRERGWHPANSPAEANLLVVAGAVDGAAERYLDHIWSSMPAPRARATIHQPADATQALDHALAELHNLPHQRQQATQPQAGSAENNHAGMNHGNTSHDAAGHDPKMAHSDHAAGHHDTSHDAAGHDHTTHTEVAHNEHAGGHDTSHDAAGHDHTAHTEMAHSEHAGGHDHHMAGMAMPGDIPMADRAADRDGLMLDQLTVPLGPALPLWPAGLIVHTRLQGDVIQEATVEVVGTGHGGFWSDLTARRLDSSARLLALAGWQDAAITAQRLRDAALADALPADRLRKWARKVGKSRTLRWLLAGVGHIPTSPTTPPHLAGDAHTRLRHWLTGTGSLPDRHETQWTVDNLPALLAGTELATARLIVASLDPDLDLLTTHEAHHG